MTTPINASHWRAVDQICEQAQLRSPQDRSAFVVQACGKDATLRQEVEEILAQAAALNDALRTETAAADAQDSNSPDASGCEFGAYRIAELLGAGGMGRVYRGHDPRLSRDVAIFLVHELLEGRTLKDVLRDGALPFDKARRALEARGHGRQSGVDVGVGLGICALGST